MPPHLKLPVAESPARRPLQWTSAMGKPIADPQRFSAAGG